MALAIGLEDVDVRLGAPHVATEVSARWGIIRPATLADRGPFDREISRAACRGTRDG